MCYILVPFPGLPLAETTCLIPMLEAQIEAVSHPGSQLDFPYGCVCGGVMIKRVKRGSGNRSLPHDCADIFIASILLVDTQQAVPSPTSWTDQDSLLENPWGRHCQRM